MESKTNAPSFTVSLRGYDRMEVDEYLDSLAEALGQVEEAEEKSRGLQAHVDRLNARIADLEERIGADVPKTGAILGERIAILLRAAEETAADTVNRAETTAAQLVDKAHEEVAAAEDQARGAIQRGEEQARSIESAARAEAAEIIAEAEGRASTRTRQIEQWAEQVISHTRAEEARMLAEQQEKREQAQAELNALTEQRDAVAANIAQLRESLGQALGLVGSGGALSLAAVAGAKSLIAAGAGIGAGEDSGSDGGGVDDGDGRGGDDGGGGGVGGAHTGEGAALASLAAGTLATGTDTDPPGSDGHETDGATRAEGLDGADAADLTADDTDGQLEEDEMPWPAAFRPLDEVDDGAGGAGADRTGEIELRDSIERREGAADEDGADAADDAGATGNGGEAGGQPDEFDTKFEAWVSGTTGPRHFRRL